MSSTGNKIVLFNEGEALIAADLNLAQAYDRERAWEWPAYANLTAFDGCTNYPSQFESSTFWDGKKYGVFTRGGGIRPYISGSDVKLYPGFIGVYTSDLPPDSFASNMRWVWMSADHWSYAHPAAASGMARYDLVTCAVNEVDSGATSRLFEDATTGAKTTSTFNKTRGYTLDLDPATAVLALAESATPSFPTVADVATGRRAVYIAKVTDAGVTAVYDCTIPYGRLEVHSSRPRDYIDDTNSWQAGYYGKVTALLPGAGLWVFPPESVMCSPHTRYLGVAIDHNLASSSSITLRPFDLSTMTPGTSVRTLSTTMDGSHHTAWIDLRGFPHETGLEPIWNSQSLFAKNSMLETVHTMTLLIASGMAGADINSVRWYTVTG